MGLRGKVFCGLAIFFIVFGLRFFCANCQRYPPQQPLHQQQIQIQKFPQQIPLQHQLQAVTYPLQKDLHLNENRLQTQVRLCSNGRLVFPCPKHYRKPFLFMLPIPVTSPVQTTSSAPPQVVLRTGASLVVQDESATAAGQKEYFSDWSHVENKNSDHQGTLEPQQRPGKNCKRKRRPQSQISTTEYSPLQQYWRGHVEDEEPIKRQKTRFTDAIPTQISERIHEPSTTRFSGRIGEALSSQSSEISDSTKFLEASRDASSQLRNPLPSLYSEKIGEFNPTKESLIARQPITSTVFDKIQASLPTRIVEKNKESYSPQSQENFHLDLSSSVMPETIRQATTKKVYARNRDSLVSRNSERIREPLAALEKEQKLSEQRDKHRQDSAVPETPIGNRDKSYRRPYSQAKKETAKPTYTSKEEPQVRRPSQKSPIDLKEILKNSGGLSLSEILQQKNLSLDDLLKGKQNALLALQTTAASPEKPSQSSSKEWTMKPVRRTPLISTTTAITSTSTTEANESNQSKEQSSTQEESVEVVSGEISSQETEDNKTSSDLSSIRKNFKFPSRVRMNTTTKRQQHFETTVQQKFSTTTTTTSKPSTTRIPFYKKRQHTRPNLMKTSSLKNTDKSSTSESREATESQESSATTYNYSKRSRFKPSTTTTTESIADITDPSSNFVDYSAENEILIQSEDTDNSSFIGTNTTLDTGTSQEENKAKSQEEPTTDHIYRYNSLKNYIDNNLPHAVFMDIDLADVDPIDDRTDLLELIEDRRSGNRLIKVLEQRNMTLEELIEHRKRGSSQLHLATFVQNRSGVFPGKKVVVNDDMDIVTAFENFPHFNLMNLKSVKPDEIKTDSQGSSYFTSIIDIEPTDDSSKESLGPGATQSRRNPIRNPNNSNIQRQPFYPSWKSLALASLKTTENAKRFLQRADLEPPQQTAQRHQSSVSEEDPILQIEDEVARAHDLVDLELSGHGFKRNAMNLMHTSEVPSGIRSAMVASAAIVLSSLVAFMVVFVACRWKQRRRRHKIDYMETYSSMKSKIPSRNIDEFATSTTSLGMEDSPSSMLSRSSSLHNQHQHRISIVFPGVDNGYPTAASVSAQSSKLNTKDPNSSHVQKYLFDTLRESF